MCIYGYPTQDPFKDSSIALGFLNFSYNNSFPYPLLILLYMLLSSLSLFFFLMAEPSWLESAETFFFSQECMMGSLQAPSYR